MIEMLDTYDWREAFKYAGEVGDDSSGWRNEPYPYLREAVPKADYDMSPFIREDVKHIQGYEEGINDEESWIIYGELYDGRWFYLEAWCDYTGWG